jgi:autoinducer 2-degrading protein
MFAVVVTLNFDPANEAEFMPLTLQNAQATLHDEPGCRQFDVCTDDTRPGEVFLYETYDDADAFDVHLQTPHFKRFDAAVTHLVTGRDVRTFAQVQS